MNNEGAEPERAQRVLIVDDHADAADSFALLLGLEGFETRAVYSSHAAMMEMRLFDPEVVLLDLGLPNIDGYALAKSIKASGSTARLIVVSGYARSEDVAKTLAAGCEAHLAKPVDLEHLLKVLSRKE